MAACSDPTYEPGPVALLDETALSGPLEPPTLTPIAQTFADSTGPWLTALDAAYGALALEQGLDLTSTLGAVGSDALQANGFAGVASVTRPPTIVRRSTVAGVGGPATLDVLVTDGATGAPIPSASIVVLQSSYPAAALLADSQGRASTPGSTGPFTVMVSAPGYASQIVSVQATGDTGVAVTLGAAGAPSSAGDVADEASQLAVLRDALVTADGTMRHYWTYTGANPNPGRDKIF